VVAGDLQSVGVRELAHLGRRALVVVAADLELGIAGIDQDLERARHVELVVGEQVADGEQLDADTVERDVAALAEAIVLVAAAMAAAVMMRPREP
jgi:hypothetical protein